uniref:LRAT domain-containing protein n=1 Tax=Amphilophus citrinellus TaxID=61819 RepID=A0A3Q0TAM8_AMPCI
WQFVLVFIQRHEGGGQALTDLYNSRVQRAELMNRPLYILSEPFQLGPSQWVPISHSGVRVTLDDGSQWLIHKGSGFGLSSQTVVTDARHISSAWQTVREREFHGSKTVSDFVGAGGPNYDLLYDNCHDGADRMMGQ